MATAQELVATYIKYRDYIAAEEHKLADKLKPYNEAMTTVATYVLDLLNSQGGDSIKTDAGTAYIVELDSMKVTDRDKLMTFVLESGETQILNAAVAKEAVRDYMAEHSGQLPPGVEKSTIRKVNFRRS